MAEPQNATCPDSLRWFLGEYVSRPVLAQDNLPVSVCMDQAQEAMNLRSNMGAAGEAPFGDLLRFARWLRTEGGFAVTI
jgi:hypothetical protein